MVAAMLLWAVYSVLVRRRPAALHPNAMPPSIVFAVCARRLPLRLSI